MYYISEMKKKNQLVVWNFQKLAKHFLGFGENGWMGVQKLNVIKVSLPFSSQTLVGCKDNIMIHSFFRTRLSTGEV